MYMIKHCMVYSGGSRIFQIGGGVALWLIFNNKSYVHAKITPKTLCQEIVSRIGRALPPLQTFLWSGHFSLEFNSQLEFNCEIERVFSFSTRTFYFQMTHMKEFSTVTVISCQTCAEIPDDPDAFIPDIEQHHPEIVMLRACTHSVSYSVFRITRHGRVYFTCDNSGSR